MRQESLIFRRDERPRKVRIHVSQRHPVEPRTLLTPGRPQREPVSVGKHEALLDWRRQQSRGDGLRHPDGHGQQNGEENDSLHRGVTTELSTIAPAEDRRVVYLLGGQPLRVPGCSPRDASHGKCPSRAWSRNKRPVVSFR
jgi:hypothetical protein